MKTNRASKRILSVVITRGETDTDPDLSYLGEYSDTPEDFAVVATGEYEGEFVDQLPCECGHAKHSQQHSDEDCDCEDYDPVEIQRGREYRYFNSGSVDNNNTDEDNRTYAQQDFKRMQDYNRLEWCLTGVHATATVQLTGDLTQKVTSGGLWGIESDSDDSYLTEVENEQLDELKNELHAIGFSKRAIAAAFRNVEHRTE